MAPLMSASTRSTQSSTLTAACLSLALARRRFVLRPQARVDCRTRSICGVEATLYWRHPRLGPLAPQRYWSLAEQSGLAAELDHWLLEAACHQLGQWRAAEAGAWSITVPVSMAALQRQGFHASVCAALDRNCLPPSCLVLRVPQSALFAAPKTCASLFSLVGMGIQLSLTGLSEVGSQLPQLPQLSSAPLHEITIPKPLIDTLDRCAIARPTVGALISLWHSAGLRVVADGVGREGQHLLLAQLGCDVAQGALYSDLLRRAIPCAHG